MIGWVGILVVGMLLNLLFISGFSSEEVFHELFVEGEKELFPFFVFGSHSNWFIWLPSFVTSSYYTHCLSRDR